jgi:hypothetical protein
MSTLHAPHETRAAPSLLPPTLHGRDHVPQTPAIIMLPASSRVSRDHTCTATDQPRHSISLNHETPTYATSELAAQAENVTDEAHTHPHVRTRRTDQTPELFASKGTHQVWLVRVSLERRDEARRVREPVAESTRAPDAAQSRQRPHAATGIRTSPRETACKQSRRECIELHARSLTHTHGNTETQINTRTDASVRVPRQPHRDSEASIGHVIATT